jgi:hypothetical protein
MSLELNLPTSLPSAVDSQIKGLLGAIDPAVKAIELNVKAEQQPGGELKGSVVLATRLGAGWSVGVAFDVDEHKDWAAGLSVGKVWR